MVSPYLKRPLRTLGEALRDCSSDDAAKRPERPGSVVIRLPALPPASKPPTVVRRRPTAGRKLASGA